VFAVFPILHFTGFFRKFTSNSLAKRAFFLWNAAFALANPDVISLVHLAPFVMRLNTDFE
jgi:hypothetical protein